ncbi:MAG TPA: DUF883 family protein [Burkholderiaceae bacterium]|jgi:ElaB/YqjD/DUF883 family membrane-anchored ribosome-binding protein|nr:DUF883 family protein [Burkholderiaceae bacterium]
MEKTRESGDMRDKLASNLQAVIKDAEDLLKSTSQQVDERYQSARAKFETTLKSAKSGLSSAEESLVTRTREAAQNTNEYVHGHPWQSVGIGAVAGLIIGLLVGRK